MGVKDLWPILGPVREELSLLDLAGKRLAVDLSGWVCESCTAKVSVCVCVRVCVCECMRMCVCV